MKCGFFISFEGSEGCGKSTHIKMLAEYFANKGFECLLTREPGGTQVSEKIRDILLDKGNCISQKAEILLFEAARAQHVDELISPALKEGKIVICDRFADSTSAYQGAARKIDANSVEWLNKFATSALAPDLTLVLDISAELGLARAKKRDLQGSDRMGSEKLPFYEAVRNAFLNLAKTHPDRVKVIDSSGEKEETFEKILSAVKEKFDV